MTFPKAWLATYRSSLAFLFACPLLALVPVVFEMIQHVAEVHIGMYDSIAQAKALEHHPLRMGFGYLKVIGLTLPTYWVTRFIATRDLRFASAWDWKSIRLFAGVLAFQLALAALQLFVLPETTTVVLTDFVIGSLVTCLIVAWQVAASLGNPVVGPRRSVRVMAPYVPWTFVFLLAAMLPLMIPHYVLSGVALAGPKSLLWPVLIVDALLVGWLSAVMVASGYYAARRAAERSGIMLTPREI